MTSTLLGRTLRPAHLDQAAHRVVRERAVEGREQDQPEGGRAQREEEGVRRGGAKAIKHGVEHRAGLHPVGVGQYARKRHERGSAAGFQYGRDDNQAQHEAAAAFFLAAEPGQRVAVGCHYDP